MTATYTRSRRPPFGNSSAAARDTTKLETSTRCKLLRKFGIEKIYTTWCQGCLTCSIGIDCAQPEKLYAPSEQGRPLPLGRHSLVFRGISPDFRKRKETLWERVESCVNRFEKTCLTLLPDITFKVVNLDTWILIRISGIFHDELDCVFGLYICFLLEVY